MFACVCVCTCVCVCVSEYYLLAPASSASRSRSGPGRGMPSSLQLMPLPCVGSDRPSPVAERYVSERPANRLAALGQHRPRGRAALSPSRTTRKMWRRPASTPPRLHQARGTLPKTHRPATERQMSRDRCAGRPAQATRRHLEPHTFRKPSGACIRVLRVSSGKSATSTENPAAAPAASAFTKDGAAAGDGPASGIAWWYE